MGIMEKGQLILGPLIKKGEGNICIRRLELIQNLRVGWNALGELNSSNSPLGY